MSAWERESGELPAPNLPPFGRKAGRGLFVVLQGARAEAGSPPGSAARKNEIPFCVQPRSNIRNHVII